ncbi:MAG TPA: transglutaminase domain-containing protein [Anaerolineae bacterium]|nr:transglutaminase domain-containing protein [Anaerolineae bacterium]
MGEWIAAIVIAIDQGAAYGYRGVAPSARKQEMFPELELKEGWVTVICFLAMSLCVAWAIQAAEWAAGLSVLQGVVALGGIVGIVLAKSRTPGRLSHPLALLIGWTWAAYLTGAALGTASELPPQVGLVELQLRVEDLILSATRGAGADNYVFVLLLACSLWLMAYFSAWAVFRWQRVWVAVIVSGVALLLNINYAKDNLTVYLIFFLLFALLLVVRASVAFYEEEWRRSQVGYSSDLVGSFLQAGLVVSIVVILLAWLAPGALASRPMQPFWDRVSEPWRRLQERSAEMFQDLNYQNAPPLMAMSDRRMLFGGPVNLTDTPVAEVVASQGRYWRVMVFHDYEGDGWTSDDPDMLLIDANRQELAFPEFDLREEITQTVRVHQDIGPTEALIAAGQPLRASVPLRAAVSLIQSAGDERNLTSASEFPAAPGDPSLLYTRQPLGAREPYQVLSSLTEADEESLREASTSYPDWVVPRYLQLPDSLPERVRLLAEQVTMGKETAYDKAKAIEAYLRQIPYNTQIQAPAPGRDGVDYFLFDIQEGYCDYYASAMTVMLRSVGVPARYVRGYSEGAREQGVYYLEESDGHAWPEVFFPGYGWVEFEPTGGEAELVRAATRASRADDPGRDVESMFMRDNLPQLDDAFLPGERGEIEGPGPDVWGQLRRWVLPLVLVLAAGGLVYAVLRFQRAREIDGLTAAERVYLDLINWVRRLLRIEPLEHQTPHEYAGLVGLNVPAGRYAMERIADCYVQERFGGKVVSDGEPDQAWEQAWPTLWRRWVEWRTEKPRAFWEKITRLTTRPSE